MGELREPVEDVFLERQRVAREIPGGVGARIGATIISQQADTHSSKTTDVNGAPFWDRFDLGASTLHARERLKVRLAWRPQGTRVVHHNDGNEGI